MSRIAVLIDDDFEDSEYTEPVKAFKKAGHELIHLGLNKGAIVKGKKQKTPVQINKSLQEAMPKDFDALLIPGGYSPDLLRLHKEAVNFVREFAGSGKPVFAICHAPQLLITADVLKGRKITGWPSIIQDIKNAGAEYLDQEVVEDHNIVSSRGPQDIAAFVRKSLEKLQMAHV